MNEVHQWKDLYGDFQYNRNFHNLDITNLDKESGWIRGEIVQAIRIVPGTKSPVLLPGEPNGVKYVYAELLKIRRDQIVTTGLGEQFDVNWNFEEPPPVRGKYMLIISQAMLEHLIDPFQHMKDLIELLDVEGHLITHTVIPGFPYHRYPVDCMRFYPDWFEEIAKRFPIKIVWKYLGEQRILYTFKKEKAIPKPWWHFFNR